jgi:bifunctional NMN adenylyltransferase/nudix hydrolase
MTKQYSRAILIGRFEPSHNGHYANFMQASEIADKVIILIGSSFQPQTPKNPFTFAERKEMILMAFKTSYKIAPEIYPLKDYKYSNNSWISSVQSIIKQDSPGVADSDICILGFDKDDSSWYNHAFPEWKFVPLSGFVEHGAAPIDATKVRELYFEGHLDYIQGAVPKTVFNFLKEWKNTEKYAEMVTEYKFYRDYDASGFPRIEQTTDAIVIQGGHILLIERGHSPGKGLWALPGGFLNPKERLFDGMIRELLEETKIKVPEIILRKAMTYQERFDAPDRDIRGRVITEAFLIELDGGTGELPRVKGSDDARRAKWFKISEVTEMGEYIYGDHLHIIQTMVARAKK